VQGRGLSRGEKRVVSFLYSIHSIFWDYGLYRLELLYLQIAFYLSLYINTKPSYFEQPCRYHQFHKPEPLSANTLHNSACKHPLSLPALIRATPVSRLIRVYEYKMTPGMRPALLALQPRDKCFTNNTIDEFARSTQLFDLINAPSRLTRRTMLVSRPTGSGQVHYYLRRRRRLCFSSVCLSVCLSVRRITRKLVNGF